MSWSKSWDKPKSEASVELKGWGSPTQPIQSPPTSPSNPWDALNQDQLLMQHQQLQIDLSALKAEELELRKYIVNRAFPQKSEGVNKKDLGSGYILKSNIKYNYRLSDNDTVEACLDNISKIGNQGSFIADRLVSWSPNFLLTEYRQIQEAAEKGSEEAKAILKEIEPMLTIIEAAPTLEIVEPKDKK